ncbi:MAG: hypothetical protein JOZ75_13275 [Candidatus Dormibacteraeota bacterium]|nr:hypothetical protein [Candidatus Dormibacteraeota bacterium]
MADGKAHYDAGQFPAAAADFARAAAAIERMPKRPELLDDTLLTVLFLQGGADARGGDARRAIQTFARVAEARERRGDGRDATLAWEAAARVTAEIGSLSEAETFARRALAAAGRGGGADTRRVQTLLDQVLAIREEG